MRRVAALSLALLGGVCVAIAGQAPSPVASAIERLVAASQRVAAVYRPYAHEPVWVSADGRPTLAAADAIGLLATASDEGLDPDDYDAEHLRAAATSLPSADPTAVAQFDVGLSAALLQYLRDLHSGRVDPRSIGFTLNVPRDDHDFSVVLRNAASTRRVIEAAHAWRPRGPQYPALAIALRRYRDLARDDVPFTFTVTKSIHPGERCAGVGDLLRRLVFLGDADPGASLADSEVYAGPVVDAVRHFQRRHGLEADGVLGRQTVAMLAVPMTSRVRQLELAMERLRWLPHESDRRLILVNIPMFTLFAWDTVPPAGAPAFTTGTIVGRALRTNTPVFAATLDEIIFRPAWNVPTSITRKEILPKLARDPGYLEREQIELVAGQGDRAPVVAATPENVGRVRTGAVRLRQRPGPKNSLGLIKFSFPNEHDVYMHATPAQALFAKSRRDFSHGCVRVQDPVGLAAWVLAEQPDWTRDRIVSAMNDAVPSRVAVGRPISVVLFYSTAAVLLDSGAVAFADDIYRHDERLDVALRNRSVR